LRGVESDQRGGPPSLTPITTNTSGAGRTAVSHVAIGVTLTVMSSPTLATELTELDG
jgi:hypothetical protein